MALGLYRSSQSPDRDRLPYVYAAPRHETPLRADDRVFVLASGAWAERHDPEFFGVMLERAALCVQAHWRGRRARRAAGRAGFVARARRGGAQGSASSQVWQRCG